MGAWGYGLFQSDHDHDLVSDLSSESGLHKMEEDVVFKAKDQDEVADNRICYSIYAPSCSDPELVRQHLDSGVLVELIKKKEAKLLSSPQEHQWYDPCYVYIILGACAMTLGCTLPEPYTAMLKKVYSEGGLMPDAIKQMRKALFGPDSFKNGVPYDFESKDLLETANSVEDRQPNRFGFFGMNVVGPGGLFNTGMGDSTTSAIIKELRDKHESPDSCGHCGAKHNPNEKTLMHCARCKDRRYCGAECQEKHWKVHKKVCEPVQKEHL